MSDYLTHCLQMAKQDLNYASKAAKWYAGVLERPDILMEFEKVHPPQSKPGGRVWTTASGSRPATKCG